MSLPEQRSPQAHAAVEPLSSDIDRLLARHLPGLLVVTEGGIVRWATPSTESFLGRHAAEIIGQPMADWLHPDDRRAPDVTPATPVATRRLRVSAGDGTYRWLHERVSGEFTPDGTPSLLCHVLRDADEIAVLEDRVTAAQQRKHDALDASPDGFAIYDVIRDGAGLVTGLRLHFINKAGADGFSRAPAALIGRDLRDFYPDATEHGLWADLITALYTGQRQHTQVEMPAAAGGKVVHGIQVRLDADTVMSTWRDVSDTVRIQRLSTQAHVEAETARATLQAAIDAISEYFIVVDLVREPDGATTGFRIVTSNVAATASRGLNPEQARGIDPVSVAPEWATSGLADQVLLALTEGRPRTHRATWGTFGEPDFRAIDSAIACVTHERAVITGRDVTNEVIHHAALEAQRTRAERTATHDALTDLPNRTLLLERLAEALRTAGADESVGVIFCDLNDFKSVNDTHGHAAGDAVLRSTAQRLTQIVRAHDTAARLSGDEFVIVLRHLPADWNAQAFVDRATEVLSRPVDVGGTRLSPSASLGIYVADPWARPHADSDPETVIARADEAMYQTKQRRRQAQGDARRPGRE